MVQLNAIDHYRLVITTEVGDAKKNVADLDRIIKKLEASGKNANKTIRDMDDQEFQHLFLNIEGIKKGMKGFSKNVDESVINMRFLTRGLHGFRMDLLNVLFLGMSLSATFGGMRAGTAMGEVFSSLGGVLAELTVGQSHILDAMVGGMINLINTASEHPEVAAYIGDIAVALGLAGAIMVPLATLTMAAGSMYGTEGLPATLRILTKDLFGGPFGGTTATGATKGILGGFNFINKLAKAGATIAITMEVIQLISGEGSVIDLLGLAGIYGLTSVKDWSKVSKFGKGAAVAAVVAIGVGFLMEIPEDGSASWGQTIISALTSGIIGFSTLTALGVSATFAAPVAAVIGVGIAFYLSDNLRELAAKPWEYIMEGLMKLDDWLDSKWWAKALLGMISPVTLLASEGAGYIEDKYGPQPTQGPTQRGSSGVTNIFNNMQSSNQSSSPYVFTQDRYTTWG